jgi:hypothetical protein
MFSYLLYVCSLLNSGVVAGQGGMGTMGKGELGERVELVGGGVGVKGDGADQDGVTGGLVVKMGPVRNLRVVDAPVTPQGGNAAEMPRIAPKGNLSRGLSLAVRHRQ